MTHPTLRQPPVAAPARPTLVPRALLSALLAAPLALASLLPGVARAATLDPDPADAASTYNVLDNPAQPFSTQRTADTTFNLGRQGTTARFYQTLVFPFQLPYLGVGSTPFQTASFTFRLTAKNGTLTGRNADLYALPPRTAADVLPGAASATAGDFFMGGVNGAGADDTTPGVIKLQDNILVATSVAGAITTDATAGAALVNYLNTAYEGGAGAGRWVFLRLSMDADPGGVVSYVVGAVNNTTAANRPFITFTAVTNNPTEFFWTGLQSGEWSLGPIDGPKNWTADGAPADYTNATAVVFNDSATGSRTVDLSVTDVSPATVVVSNSAGAYTLQGSRGIAQAFRLTKDGSGLLVLATSNNYSGPTTVAAGTLQLGAAGAIPDGAGKGDVSVSGTLDLNGFSEGINGLSGSGLIDNTAAGAATLAVGGNNKSTTFSGVIQQTGGTVSLTKVGSGTLTLAGANTYAGTTLIQTGTVTVTHGSGLGTTAGGTEFTASGTATGPRVIVSGGITIAENFLLGGATDVGGGNAAILSQAGTNTLTGGITLSNLTGAFRLGVLSNSALSTLNLSGSLAQVGSTQSLVLAALNNAVLRVNTPVANNGAELQVISTAASGSGVVQLNAASGTGLGQTRVNVTGTLQLGVANALNPAADLLIGQASGNTSTLAGNDIGRVDLNGFHLAVNALNGFPNTTTNAAAANRRVLTNSAASGSSTLTLGGANGSGIFNGAIVEGAGSSIALVKNGSGTQSLNGTNTYTGSTTVNAGKLLVNGATGPGAVSIQSGATLGGTGLVGGAVTANAGSTVSPGPDGGIGRLSLDQTILLANSTLAIQLNGPTEGSYDQLASTLDYVLQQPNLVVTLGYTPAAGDQYLIVTGGPLAFPDGQFAGLPDGATFGAGGSLFLINYRAGDGNDVLLTCLGTPNISSAGPLSGGSFPLTFSGPPGQAYQVLTSTNVTLPLTNWTVLTSGTFTAAPVTYTDTGATNAQRFYRLKLP